MPRNKTGRKVRRRPLTSWGRLLIATAKKTKNKRFRDWLLALASDSAVEGGMKGGIFVRYAGNQKVTERVATGQPRAGKGAHG
jgi:hypothetical protein